MHQNRFLGRPRSAYSAPPDPQLYLRGLLLRGRRGKGKRGGKGKGVELENDLIHPLSQIPGYATATVRIKRPVLVFCSL